MRVHHNSGDGAIESRTKRIRVLLVTFTGGTGGIAVLLRNLLKRLKSDYELEFEICFTQDLGIIADEIRSFGVPVHYLGMKSGFDVRRAIPLIPIIRRGRYDLVNFHGLVPLVRLMIVLSGARQIVEEHGGIKEEEYRGRWLNPLLHRLLDRCTHGYITVSDDSIRDLVTKHGVKPSKITKIYNGIDISLFNPKLYDQESIRKELGIPPSALVFGTVRGLTEKMGIDHFISAADVVGRTHLDAYFVIVGDGPLLERLRAMASRTAMSKRIIFAGMRRDIPRVLRGIDVFALPSVWEALPIAAIESQAMGVPVIAYDVGGTSEVVIDGVTGLLVKRRNHLDFARAMETLYCDSELRRRLGAAGFANSRQLFSIDRIALEFKDYFKRQVG